MPVAAADLHFAINVVWDNSVLDDTFQALWDSSVTVSEFPVLNDQEATPEHPFPYCVFEQVGSETTDRMSGGIGALREIRDVSISFRVHARAVSGDSRTAKKIAADMAEEILKVFGGHPKVSPTDSMPLENGNFLISQYQDDFGIREGDDEYMWTVNYIFRLDVPVRV